MRAFLLVALLTGCAAIARVDAGDRRFEACNGTKATVDATVAFTARDYLAHFPLMGKSPELESDAPAFAVVFAEGERPPVPLLPQLRPDGAAPPAPEQSHRTVCIYVGQPPDGEMNIYLNVDVALLLP